jgi:hypothetical protein
VLTAVRAGKSNASIAPQTILGKHTHKTNFAKQDSETGMIIPINPRPEVEEESKKLTKKFFMGLPAGVFLASNCFTSPQKPMFAQYVVPLEEREKQWKQICKANVDQRNCHTFKDEVAFRKWLAWLGTILSKR